MLTYINTIAKKNVTASRSNIMRSLVVIIKSQPIAIDGTTGLQRYGFVETRCLIYLCNHLHQMQDSSHDDEFDAYVRNEITLNIKDMVTALKLLEKDARRIFSHTNDTFNRGIQNKEVGLWVESSTYRNGEITVRISEGLIRLLKERNPYLFNFHISQIKYINSISAIRFLNYLYANKFHAKKKSELTLTLHEIRTIFGVESSYNCLSNIRSKIIGRSITILNSNTKLKIYVKRKKAAIEDLNYHFVIESQ